MKRCPECRSPFLKYMEDGTVMCTKCKHRYTQREHEHAYTVHFFVSDDYSIPVKVMASDVEQAKDRAVEVLDNMRLRMDEQPRVLDEYQMQDLVNDEKVYGNSYRSVDSYAKANHYHKECSRRTVFEPKYYHIDAIERDGRYLKDFDKKGKRKPLINLFKKGGD